MKTNQWYEVRGQSLAVYARNAGFDLAVYHEYSDTVQEELQKRAVKQALIAIEAACDDQEFDIADISNGVYVISLSSPLSIKYKHDRSQVIYIGMGNIMARIKVHFMYSLFQLMQDLAGADFDLYFARPWRRGVPGYYKHVEYLMLEYFSERYGGLHDKRRFPMLNRNAGTSQNLRGGKDWWKKPLRARRTGTFWALEPTEYSDYAPLD